MDDHSLGLIKTARLMKARTSNDYYFLQLVEGGMRVKFSSISLTKQWFSEELSLSLDTVLKGIRDDIWQLFALDEQPLNFSINRDNILDWITNAMFIKTSQEGLCHPIGWSMDKSRLLAANYGRIIEIDLELFIANVTINPNSYKMMNLKLLTP